MTTIQICDNPLLSYILANASLEISINFLSREIDWQITVNNACDWWSNAFSVFVTVVWCRCHSIERANELFTEEHQIYCVCVSCGLWLDECAFVWMASHITMMTTNHIKRKKITSTNRWAGTLDEDDLNWEWTVGEKMVYCLATQSLFWLHAHSNVIIDVSSFPRKISTDGPQRTGKRTKALFGYPLPLPIRGSWLNTTHTVIIDFTVMCETTRIYKLGQSTVIPHIKHYTDQKFEDRFTRIRKCLRIFGKSRSFRLKRSWIPWTLKSFTRYCLMSTARMS